MKYFRFHFIFYVKLQPLLKKVTPLFSSNPPLKSFQAAHTHKHTHTHTMNVVKIMEVLPVADKKTNYQAILLSLFCSLSLSTDIAKVLLQKKRFSL